MKTAVLLVEHNPESLAQLQTYVVDCGVRVQTAVDLASAQARLSEDRFSIVIVDWQLPNNEAAAIVRSIRENHRLRRTHIIALSEPYDAETIQSVLKMGVDDFYSRPISAGEVRTRLLWAESRLKELN